MSRMRITSRAGAVGLIAAVLVGTALGASSTAQALGGADAAVTATSSAVTLTNAKNAINPDGSPFPDLSVTVSQTKDLVSQGIRVTWTGGKKSEAPNGTVGGTNFLQIAQCWGEDPDHPGHPDRRTCQYGGTIGYGATRDGSTPAANVAAEDEQYTAPDFRRSVYTAIPFVAVNDAGAVDETRAPADRVLTALTWDKAGQQWVKKTGADAVDMNTNRFFTQYTTNEVKWAPSGADGSGSVPFEIQTAMQSSALGCGNPVRKQGVVTGQSCWLVIIPRGEGDSGSPQIDRSGLWWDAWEHSLAVKLDFKPLGVRCQIGAAEQQIAGSELLVNAVASWQPELCNGKNGAAFVQRIGAESDALRDASGTAPSALALTSLPLDTDGAGLDADPLAYAPIALSGAAISFAIDASPDPQSTAPGVEEHRGLPLTDLKLTPRLVAKLLTASYVDSLPNGADKSHIGYKSFTDPGKNPRSIVQDPDFWAVNGGPDGEWAQQNIVGASVADALTPDGRSDIATQLWNYVLSDPATVKWLNGEPDEWGMVVNPYYSTSAKTNPTGTGLALPRDNFPKGDPIEKPDTTVSDPNDGSGVINLVTWRPYTANFADGAYHVLRGDGMLPGAWDKFSTPPKFGKSVRELFGSQRVIALTTAPAAEQYQTVTAALRNPAGQFVKPTRTSIAAAAKVMSESADQPQVRVFDQGGGAAKRAKQAYPLAMPVYAALNPKQTDPKLRATYANLIRFAVLKGQRPGTDLGELPPGYAPLPKSWVSQAVSAANAIQGKPGKARPEPDAGPDEGSGADGAGDTGGTAPDADPGETTEALGGAPTPDDPPVGPLTLAVPAGLAAGTLAAAAVPLIGRFRRRA